MLSKDRMVEPQQINLYLYCRNNPLNLLDPSGETIDFEKDRKGHLTKDGEYSQQKYLDYKASLMKDPKKNAKELKTLQKLESSTVNYRVSVVTHEITGSHETEGLTSTDGTNVLITIRNIGGATGEKFTLDGRFAHEFEHGRQFEDGELSFVNINGSWQPNPRDYDIYDEVNAFKAQLDVSPPTADTPMLTQLRDPRLSDEDRAGVLRNVGGYKPPSQRQVNVSYGGAKPGELIRPDQKHPNFFGRNHP